MQTALNSVHMYLKIIEINEKDDTNTKRDTFSGAALERAVGNKTNRAGNTMFFGAKKLVHMILVVSIRNRTCVYQDKR